MKKLKLKNKIDEIYNIHEIINSEIGVEDFQLELIIEEIFTNIIKYSKAENITLSYEYQQENICIYLEFIDDGTPFNPLLKEDPKQTTNIEDTQIGGLGIYLSKNLADNIEYEYINNENHVKITKKVK